MDTNHIVFALIFAAAAFVGAVGVTYQIYQITVIDAKTRHLKHPKLWGWFSMSGNNSSGLLFYLIGRRKYPVIQITDAEKSKIASRKTAAGIGLIFLTAGAIGLFVCVALS